MRLTGVLATDLRFKPRQFASGYFVHPRSDATSQTMNRQFSVCSSGVPRHHTFRTRLQAAAFTLGQSEIMHEMERETDGLNEDPFPFGDTRYMFHVVLTSVLHHPQQRRPLPTT